MKTNVVEISKEARAVRDKEKAALQPGPLDGAYNAAELQDKKFPPPNWIIPNILPEGLSLLVAPPKTNKTFLSEHVALCVAAGEPVFGNYETERGRVLYLDFEQSDALIQERLKLLLPGRGKWPDALLFKNEFRSQAKGGLDDLKTIVEKETWGKNGALPLRLIVIDTWAYFRGAPLSNTNTDLYRADVHELKPLADFARKHHLALLIVHHTSKRVVNDGDDPFTAISGTTGVFATAETALLIQPGQNGASYTLTARGRRVKEISKALEFKNCQWSVLGEARDYALSVNRRKVIEAIRALCAKGGYARVAEITAEAEMSNGNVRKVLSQLAKEGRVIRHTGALYSLPGLEAETKALDLGGR